MASIEEENAKHRAVARNLLQKNDLYRKECGQIKKEMVNFKQLISAINKQQTDFDKKLKPLTKLNNANLARENESLKENIENMTEGNKSTGLLQ